jgi:hypothetical protein
MERAWINYWIDAGLLVSFILAGVTGIIKLPVLLSKLNLSVGTIIFLSVLHDWSGVVLVVLSGVHVVLHWNWIVAMTKRLWVRK